MRPEAIANDRNGWRDETYRLRDENAALKAEVAAARLRGRGLSHAVIDLEAERDRLREALEVIATGKRHKVGHKVYEEPGEFFARDTLDALRESAKKKP